MYLPFNLPSHIHLQPFRYINGHQSRKLMVWTLTDCVDGISAPNQQNKCPTVSRVRLTTLLDGRVAGTTQPRCNHRLHTEGTWDLLGCSGSFVDYDFMKGGGDVCNILISWALLYMYGVHSYLVQVFAIYVCKALSVFRVKQTKNIKIARFGWAAVSHHDYLRSAYKVRHFVSHILQTLPSSHISRSCTHVLTQ